MSNPKLQTVAINNLDYTPLLKDVIVCPKCQVTPVKKPEGNWIGKCPICKNSYIIFWKPFPSQLIALALLRLQRTTPLYVYNFGAMNTGKTDIDCFAAVQFALEHPGTTQGFLARDFQMMKRVIPESLDPFIHSDWLARRDGKVRKSIDNGYYFENGSKFLFLPSDDEKKVRSMNTSRWIVIEGENIPVGLIHALSGRLRQDSGVQYAKNDQGEYVLEKVRTTTGQIQQRRKIGQSYYSIVVEANPDPNSYVFDEGLLESNRIYHTTSVRGLKDYQSLKVKNNDYKFSVISATPDSPYVKEGYIEEKMQTWSPDEVRANLFGEFVATDNLIFKGAQFCFEDVDENELNPDWPHWLSIDPGVGDDPCAMLLKCYHPERDLMVYYRESYEYHKNLQEIAEIIKGMTYGLNLQDIIIDPSSKATRQLVNNTSTKIELEGLLHRPLIEGVNRIDDGIMLVRSRMSEKKIVFSNKLENLYREFMHYSYKPGENKPKMGFDHLMDALRYNEQRTRSDAGYDIMKQWKNAYLTGTLKERERPQFTAPWIFGEQEVKNDAFEGQDNFAEMEEWNNDW